MARGIPTGLLINIVIYSQTVVSQPVLYHVILPDWDSAVSRKAKTTKSKRESDFDGGESTSAMMPAVISEDSKYRGELDEKVLELTQKSLKFKASLPTAIVEPLASLVRTMNCYYSNLIEGGNTKPIDIERALHGDYSEDPEKRDLQLEAKAHVSVQA